MHDPFDLLSTYVHLHDEHADVIEGGDAFWQKLQQGTDEGTRVVGDNGWLVTVFPPFEGEWSTWEKHPSGDEVVHVTAGSMEFVLELPEGTRTMTLRQGQTVVVPRGTWHTARNAAACTALFVTYGEGTEVRPV